MIKLTDGRTDLFQWDTGREVESSEPVTQFHFSNKVYGRTLDVDAVENRAKIPDVLLQSPADLRVYAFVGTDLDGFTKVEKVFHVLKRNKPADYVFSPAEQVTMRDLQGQIGDLSKLDTDEKRSLVGAVNELRKTGGGGGTTDHSKLEGRDLPDQHPIGAITGLLEALGSKLSASSLPGAIRDALSQAQASGLFDGADGATYTPTVTQMDDDVTISWTNNAGLPNPETVTIKAPADGYSPQASVSRTDTGVRVSVTDKTGTTTADLTDGKDGPPGKTPDIQIGTVTTLSPTEKASASMTGTPEKPLLNLGIPQGKPGEGGGGAEWKKISVTFEPGYTETRIKCKNVTDIVCIGYDVASDENTNSALYFFVNGINTREEAISVGTKAKPLFSTSHISFNEIYWEGYTSDSALARSAAVRYKRMQCNPQLNVGKAQEIELTTVSARHNPTSGRMEVYYR